MDRPESYTATATLGDTSIQGEPKVEKFTYGRDIGETQATAPDALRIENDMDVMRTERSEDTGRLVDKPTRIAKKITVGKGAKPRANAAVPAPEPIVEDEPKFNRSA